MIPSRFTILLLLIGCAGGLAAGKIQHGWLIVAAWDAAVILLAVVDWALAGKTLQCLGAERLHGSIVSAGRTEKVTIRLKNSRSRRLLVRIVDALPEIARPQEASFPQVRLGGNSEAELKYDFVPMKRGNYPVGPSIARVMGPLGLSWRQLELLKPTSIKVYPDIKMLERYQDILRTRKLKEYGMSPVALAGHGTTFESLREFVQGDDPSRIEWKATARRNKIIVKNYEAERSQTVYLLIDSGKMMTTIIEGRSRLDYAVNSAMLLSHVIVSKGDNAGLILFSEKIKKHLPPMKNPAQIKRIADALHDADAALVEPDYTAAIRMATMRRRRSLIIIFTDIWGKEIAEELVVCTRNIRPVHLPLIVMMRDRELEDIAEGKKSSGTREKHFQMAAACQLLHERSETIAQLRSMGAIVLDVYPHQVTAGAIRKYLEVKLRNLI
ncbi:MAG: DUF58 domain-containing protein [Pseudomonadota bacterium]